MKKLNANEERVLALISENPFISQLEIAAKIQLSRSAAANIISSLVEKNYLLGKAYIVNSQEPIVAIGGANVDRKIYSKEKIQAHTSNPANSSQSVGGVARNIAENLGRLGWNVSMVTIAGFDADFNFIKKESEGFMDFSYSTQMEMVATGSYTAILEDDGSLFVALADMDAYQHLLPEVLVQKEKLLQSAKCIVADLNSPKETLEYLLHFANTNNKPLIFIPVSSPKIRNLPQDLTGLTWLITNQDESETFFKQTIDSGVSWENCAKKWLTLGVENVIITRGCEGVLAVNQNGETAYQAAFKSEKVVDVTGAGDAFCSAVIDGWLNELPLEKTLEQATLNALKTVESEYTVRPELTKNQLIKEIQAITQGEI
ncbi:MAG: winged helix-turn-helix transcriptional regulator [Streptococcaceae bacterium]|jgi:sugar/nucleoside kinase (ribokinase family)/DNA-binding CsgD family transcriptional regulator|nr:winged helix-turn-helix transcriptional regulator [Streptococcaceae bacterium]